MDLDRRYTRRMLILGGVQAACLATLAGKLYQLQVLDGSRYLPLSDDNRMSLRILAPVRGRILDRNGLVLADNQESFRVSLVPSLAGDIEKTLDLVAKIVPLSDEAKQELSLKAKRAGRGASIVIANNIDFEQVAALNLLTPQLYGVEVEIAHSRRYYPSTAIAHVVGYVGGLPRRGIDDDVALRIPGTKVGRSGIERALEKELRGKAGTRRSEIDARGRIVRHIEEVRPEAGADVHAAIDMRLQARVMQRLSLERRAAAVVMDVTSGDILALASVPSFDSNDVASPDSLPMWKRLSEAEDQPLFNRALSGQYPPGSTFKLVTALAALEAGTVTREEEIRCPGRFTIAEETYRCWKRAGHGDITLKGAIKESCDVYFYEVARRTGMKRIAAMARKLGFGESHAAGTAPEKEGIVPDADWKRWTLREGWALGDTVIASVGQGFVLATPLQLAVMTARIATGRQVAARLASVEPLRSRDFRILDISVTALETVREAMIAAVNEKGGTGEPAQPSGSIRIAGKTGTSQVRRHVSGDERTRKEGLWEDRDHALFVGYMPTENPQYAISVVIEHGGAGGTAAGPVVRDIVEYMLKRDPAAPSAGAGEAPRGEPSPPDPEDPSSSRG
jgi:penicillin-binding protein 2